jgi:hypothetical protein
MIASNYIASNVPTLLKVEKALSNRHKGVVSRKNLRFVLQYGAKMQINGP